MQIIDIDADGAFETIVKHVRTEAILLQLPTVYTLVAAPTREGVSQLDGLKDRLSGKNYGTVMGSCEKFLSQTLEQALPPFFRSASRLERMRGAFVRTAFTSEDFNSSVIRGGTHQSLIVDGIHRDLFRRVETALADSIDPELWGGREFSSLLCTSANISGDPLGSITDRVRAVDFVQQRGIGLMVTCEKARTGLGSYPIFEMSPESISVQREGPGLNRLLREIPGALQSATAA
jgi:tRNA A37 threonylcarbamoyladenosine synthetase subunit TsaC/SUA5/YrdC